MIRSCRAGHNTAMAHEIEFLGGESDRAEIDEADEQQSKRGSMGGDDLVGTSVDRLEDANPTPAMSARVIPLTFSSDRHSQGLPDPGRRQRDLEITYAPGRQRVECGIEDCRGDADASAFSGSLGA